MTATGSPADLVDEFIRRICAKDLEGACELVTADVEYDNVPMGKNIGPEGIKALLGPMIDGIDEVVFEVHRQVASGNLVMNERSDKFRVGERWIDLPVMGVFHVADGKISLWRDYFDARDFETQLAAAMA